MPVIANVNAYAPDGRVETRIAEIARPKVEFLPKAWIHVRDMRLSIRAEELPVGIDHSGGIIVDAGLLFLINGNDQHHSVLLRDVLHQLDGRAIRDLFNGLVPTCLLLGAE